MDDGMVLVMSIWDDHPSTCSGWTLPSQPIRLPGVAQEALATLLPVSHRMSRTTTQTPPSSSPTSNSETSAPPTKVDQVQPHQLLDAPAVHFPPALASAHPKPAPTRSASTSALKDAPLKTPRSSNEGRNRSTF